MYKVSYDDTPLIGVFNSVSEAIGDIVSLATVEVVGVDTTFISIDTFEVTIELESGYKHTFDIKELG